MSTPQRGWCPALNAAGEDALRFQSPSQHSGAVSPVRRPASPKDKSGVAAKWSVNTAASGTKLVDRVRKDRNFSHRLGLSASVTQGTKLLSRQAGGPNASSGSSGIDLMNYQTAKETGGIAAKEVISGQSAEHPVVARNVAHLKGMVTKGQLEDVQHVAICDCELPVEDLLSLLALPAFDTVESLALHHCLTSTDGVGRMMVELAGGAAPPEEEEKEPEIDEETGEPIEVPLPPPFVPKRRQITTLSLQGNPACFGAAAGEEPSQETLDELSKVLGNPEVLPLKTLSLRGCGLMALGGTTVTTALLPNGSVETVDLSDNQIGKNDDGTSVTAVAQLLQENKFLINVDLSENDFDAASTKQLAEAIAGSNTRVATPEPNADPDPEDYVDELPDPEEAPTVEIGYPKKEEPVAEGGDEDAAAADEGGMGAEEAAAISTKKKDDDDEDEEEEEDDEDAKKEEEVAEEEELSEEELEELREAEELAAAEKLEEEKAEWEAQQEQFIYGPTRVHMEWDESVARRVVMQEHITETTALKEEEKISRAQAKEVTAVREQEERDRRSGWTHLQSLTLDGNPLTSVGAKAISDILRKKIPLSEEEFQTADEGADEFVRKAEEAVEEAKAAMEEGAEAAKETAMNEARTKMEDDREAALAAQAEKEEAAAAADDEEGEGAATTEQEEIPVVDEDKITEIGEAAKEAFIAIEEAKPVVAIKRPEVKDDRDGVTTIQRLSLNACSIGAKGLRDICNVLATNNNTLKTLLIRRNRFGVKHVEVSPPDASEEDDPPKPMLRLDYPSWISSGMQSLGETLRVNETLVVLDLGFNGLYPANLQLLVEGLRVNRTLEVLNLDGNHLGGTANAGTLRVPPGWKPTKEEDEADEEENDATPKKSAQTNNSVEIPTEQGGADIFVQILEALCDKGNSVITTLGLSSCELGPVMTTDACKLLFLCVSLQHLNLDSNALGNQGIENISVALGECPPQLKLKTLCVRNNHFTEEASGKALGAIAKTSATLQSLAWSDNHLMGDASFAALCQGMQDHPALRRLEARKIGILDISPLNVCLSTLTFAAYIDLSDNEVSPESAAEFLIGAKHGARSLASLSMWGRTHSFDHLIPLATEVSRHCPTLVHVDIGQGLASAIQSAPLAEGEDPEDEDLLPEGERLELLCLRNRVAVATQN